MAAVGFVRLHRRHDETVGDIQLPDTDGCVKTEKEQNRIVAELECLFYTRKSILRYQQRKSGGDRAGFAGDDTSFV